jgi:hypothetical protein
LAPTVCIMLLAEIPPGFPIIVIYWSFYPPICWCYNYYCCYTSYWGLTSFELSNLLKIDIISWFMKELVLLLLLLSTKNVLLWLKSLGWLKLIWSINWYISMNEACF